MKIKTRKLNLCEVFIIFVLIFTVGGWAHFTLIDRVGFWRLIYPFQARLAVYSINCDRKAPEWMFNSLEYIIINQKNLSNQLAYIDQNNQLHACQSGWKKTALFSGYLSENNRFRYASLTKIVTSNAILQLINGGQLKLTDKMIDFFPELKDQVFRDQRIQQITIADLLEHRSGFDRMRSEDVVFSQNKRSWCPYRLAELATLKLDFEPKQRYAYDNRNYCLLGAVLERTVKQDYRSYMNQHYALNARNIKFVAGSYFLDEVQYDFRNNDFWMESDDNNFDFKALSSSAGLSGSAKQLALLMSEMLHNKPLNLLSIDSQTLADCNIYQFKSCNGYAMWQYRASKKAPVLYFRNGGLPAVTSLAMITQNNEVIVWVGNGASLYDHDYDDNLLEKHFYKIFSWSRAEE